MGAPERSVNAANDGHRRHFTRYLEAELEGRHDLVEKALPHYPLFGLRTVSGDDHPADVVVLATGFAAHEFLAGVDVRGRDGLALSEAWGPDDAHAHLGVSVPGFPNLFMLSGPNTALGHGGSQITIIELQMRYVARLVAGMLDAGSTAIEVRPEVARAYDDEVDAAHAGMIWTHPGMTNWYRNAAGRVVNTLPWRIVDYRARLEAAGLDDHRLD